MSDMNGVNEETAERTESGLDEARIGGTNAENEVVIQTFGLKRYYPITGGVLKRRIGDVKAVDGVDLRIERGSTRGLVGESGCGKSTLAELLVRLDTPTDGHIYFDVPADIADEIERLEGTDESQRSDEQESRLSELRSQYEINSITGERLKSFRRNAQFVFQNPSSSLNPRQLIRQLVAKPLKKNTNLSSAEIETRVIGLLEEVGLDEDYLYRYPHTLSGGQKQRVAIARAIATNPDLVVLDEPTSALDVSVQAQIMNLLNDLQDRLGLTYLFITHDLGVVRHIADRLSVMYLGHVVESGPCTEVFESPKHPYTEALMSSSPAIGADEEIVLEGDVPDAENPPTGCPFHSRCHKVESYCGWSGRDFEWLVQEMGETGESKVMSDIHAGLKETTFDGYDAEYLFDESVDVEAVLEVLRGEVESVTAAQSELFEAIEDVRADGRRVHVEFRDIAVPELYEDEPDHRVACHLYGDTNE